MKATYLLLGRGRVNMTSGMDEPGSRRVLTLGRRRLSPFLR